MSHLSLVDLASIAVYLVVLAAVTLWVNLKIGGADAEHYFLGGRSVPFWAIGFSLFASNLGTDHLVGLAGSGASTGLVAGNYEWSASYTLLLLAWVFVPHYLDRKIYTVPEYLEKRFSVRFRVFFTWLTIVATAVTKISVTIYSGGIVLEAVLGWNMWLSSIGLLALTAIYTTIGGLAAVVYTEVLQSIVLLVGSLAVLWFGLREVGGIQALHDQLPASQFRLLKPLNDPDFPWLGVILGMPIGSIWYWCTDQVMVQRVLAAPDTATSQRACVLAGWLKVLPMYIMVLPGLIAAALYPADVQQDSNRAFALLITRMLPHGWQGTMIAVMLSSFMAALASAFNSCSTLFTMDVYVRWVPDHTDAQVVLVGRLFTVLVAVLSLAWLPIISHSGSDQLFIYIQEMQIIWSAPVVTVFLAAIISDTVSEWTAWWTLMTGLIVSAHVWLFRQFAKGCSGFFLCPLINMNILNFSILLMGFDVLVMCVLHFFVEGHRTPSENLPLMSKQPEVKEMAEQRVAGPVTKMCAAALLATVLSLTIWHSLP